MGFNCGIVGLPNVGKSTIFSAITRVAAEAANYPFCTINPNTGVVPVPDERLQKISKIVGPQKIIPTSMEFVDIAGLVRGASKGEGLGNQFLGHIRAVDAIVHVVRCFEDSNIIHVHGKVDPVDDVSTIDTELILADLEAVTKRYTQVQKQARSGDKSAAASFSVLDKVKLTLEKGNPARLAGLETEELPFIRELNLMTMKNIIFAGNIHEDDLANPMANEHFAKLVAYAKNINTPVVPICGKVECELLDMSEDEKRNFLQDLGASGSGLEQLITIGYQLLGLSTYFTAGEKEVRAWTFKKGMKAPQTAGVIHSDFERGFIRAEVYAYNDLMTYGSEAAVKEAGKLRVEGKEYLVQDGDIMHFRFNV